MITQPRAAHKAWKSAEALTNRATRAIVGAELIEGSAMDTTLYSGIVSSGFQFASGGAVGRADNPFPHATLTLQHRHFLERGFDLDRLVPNRVLGTINVKLDRELVLRRADVTVPLLDWTSDLDEPRAMIAPETFSFVRCTFGYDGRIFPAALYYPHPETKPATNAHHYDVLEVIAPRVAGLAPGMPATISCAVDAFADR